MDLESFELVLLRRPANAPDYPEAELERIVSRQPDHTPAHVMLARLYYKLKRNADAEREQAIVARLNEQQQQLDLKRIAEHQKNLPKAEAQSAPARPNVAPAHAGQTTRPKP